MDPKDRIPRNDRQSGDGFSRSPARLNFDRICLNNLDLSSLGAAAALPVEEEKLDNSAERSNDPTRLLDEAVITEALLSRMHRLINTYPRASADQTNRARIPLSNRNGSLTSLDRSPLPLSRANNLSGDTSALANNLRDRNASGSTVGLVGPAPADFSAHQTRNDLRSANAASLSSEASAGDLPISQESRMTGMNRIVSQLMQIRESIQQANASISSVGEHDNNAETARHLGRMQELIGKLKRQEEGYIQLLSQMVDEDRASREGSTSGVKIHELNGNQQDEVESLDVPADLGQPSDGENTAESSSAAEVTQSDTAYVEDAYNELEQLRCQRDMLREILSQHEELRALQGRQVALLKMQRETQQQLIEARDKPEEGSEDGRTEDEEDLRLMPGLRRPTSNPGPPTDSDLAAQLWRRRPEALVAAVGGGGDAGSTEEEEEEGNDDDEVDNVDDEERTALVESLMSSAVPRELLELRRRLAQLTALRDDQTAEVPSPNAPQETADENSEFARLTKSKAELSDRLRDLQSKKDHLDSLLLQLQTLRDLRSSNPDDDDDPLPLPAETESTSSSLRQLSRSAEVGETAENTAQDAEEALRMLEAQQKLAKLKEVRERLDRIRSMMTYYQDATAFIHSGDDDSEASPPPVAARQRILEYGSASETSSHAEERPQTNREEESSAGGSEATWAGHPNLLARIRQLKSAKTRLHQLQSLIGAIEAGAALSDLPPGLASVAAELIGEEESEGEEAVLLSSYKSAVEDQKRELSQLVSERDKLLALQRQMEQLHAVLPESSVWSRPDEKERGGKKEAVEVLALRSLRLRPPPSSSAAAASMEALTAALQRRHVAAAAQRRDSSVTTEPSENSEATASSQQQPGQTGGRRPDTVTFQEPVATFVANDEVYENICAQRIMREELREKKREIAAIMKKETAQGGYKRNQGGSTAGTDNQSMDTALGTLYSQDMTTAATWGEDSVLSNAENENDEAEAGRATMEEETGPSAAARPFPALETPAATSPLSNPPSLQGQVASTMELCRAMLAEQRKLVSALQEQNLRSPQLPHSPPEVYAAQLAAGWQQTHSPILYSSVNFCCQRMVQMQADILSLQQQVAQVANNAAAGPASEPRSVPPLDLSGVKRPGAFRRPRQRPTTAAGKTRAGDVYRPGVSSGISGTGYSEPVEGDLDDVLSLLSDAESTKGLDLDAALAATAASAYRSFQSVGPTQGKASQKQLKQHDLARRPPTSSPKTKPDVGSHRESRPRSGKPEMSGPAGDEVGLFEALRETIYAEVASLISQNESRPNYLIDLFRELQLLSSDYLRQRVLYAIQDLVNKSLVRQSDAKVFAPRASWLRPMRESAHEEQTPSESLVTTEDEAGLQDERAGLYDGAMRKLEAKALQLFSGPGRAQTSQGGLLATLTDRADTQLGADYAEEVDSVSSLSTPQASPFAADSLGDTVIHLDKTMQLLRDLEERRQRDVEGEKTTQTAAVDARSETSSVSEHETCPNVDPQQLNEEIRGVIHFLVPMLKQVSPQACSTSLLAWVRELIMRRTRVVIARLHGLPSGAGDEAATGEFDRFFDTQLSGLLQESLRKYEGKLLADCIEDLMVDVSELLFNELAFFKLIADLEKNPCSDNFQSPTSTANGNSADKDARLEAVAAVVSLALQGDEEELDNKRDDMMASQPPASSSSSEVAEDGKKSEEDSSDDEEEESSEESCVEEEGHSASVRAVLAVSETKPMTRIGSDEDEEEEEEETDAEAQHPDTAVSFVDADEKDACEEREKEKAGVPSEASAADGDLTIDDLPAQFNLSDCKPSDILQTLPTGEAELAGSGDACPPPPSVPNSDQRALGQ